MSGTGESTVDFAGEERAFRIRLGEIRRIEAKCGNIGIGEVLRRLARCVTSVAEYGGLSALAAGVEIRADDVREPIYQGLRGGGMSDGDATRLVKAEVDERGVRGLLDNAATALAVLWASQEVPPGEQKAGENPATPESPSTSETSTEPATPSA